MLWFVCLQLTRSDGSTMTHAGVLEFVAEEGTVGLPPKVRRSLGKTGDEPLGYIKVSQCQGLMRRKGGRLVRLLPFHHGVVGSEGGGERAGPGRGCMLGHQALHDA